jgi:putative hydroxymethylpyrimidine transport system permease protein
VTAATAAGAVKPRRANGLVSRAARVALDLLPATVFLVALIAGWEAWVRVRDVPSYLVPAPSELWQAFLDQRGTLPEHTRTTLGEALLGLFFSAVLGVALAALIASVPLARRVLYPLLVLSQNIPVLVLAPLLAVWFGFGMTPKVVIVVLIGFFPIAVNTADGLLNADREMVALVRSMGANRWQVLRTVLVPSAVPSFFAGLQIGAAYAVIGAVIAEWMGASSGLGLFITRSQRAFRTDQIFMAVVLIALVSIALFGAVQLLARLVMPWRHAGAESN